MVNYFLRIAARCSLVLILGLPLGALAEEQRFEIRPGEETEVRFRSEATLEDFEGHGDQLRGWFTLDPTDLSTLRGELEFDLSSLDTGIGLRNKHMHDNVLHTEEHPKARFVVNGCGPGSLTASDMPVELEGTLHLHGVSKDTNASIVALPEGDGIRIEATFRVKLSDHEIKRPKMLVMKVAKEVDLTVRALARPNSNTASSEKVNGS